jgi:hypothetical protein
MQKQLFERLFSRLQESLLIFANMPKKTILEKSKKKRNISQWWNFIFVYI